MSVLHPTGPEEPRTYWVRRGLVIAAVLVVLAVIISLVGNALSAGSAVQANPPPVPSPLVAATPTSTSTPSTAKSASPTATPTPGAGQSTATAKAKATAKATEKATGKATEKPLPKPSVTATKKVGPIACDPTDVRVTLNGKQRLKPRQDNPFQLSVINGSDQTCTAAVNDKNFELKIYSGRDRIWSSDDCSTAVKTISPKLKTQQAAAWKMVWNGRRSRTDCKNRPEIPKAGTYFATAQLKGAKPVQLRMIIRG